LALKIQISWTKIYKYNIDMVYKVTIVYYIWIKKLNYWADGYFLTSIGNVSQTVLETYIENQG